MDVEKMTEVLEQHNPSAGIMASPNHWAYRGNWDPTKPDGVRVPAEDETPGKWFAFCPNRPGESEIGCGWNSEPTTYETKEEARHAAYRHLAEIVAEAVSTDGR